MPFGPTFLASGGHRKNILNPQYTHVGIGIIDNYPYGKMYTRHFGGRSFSELTPLFIYLNTQPVTF
ncbi:CAP domain-containing protein [Thermanaerosceptrum fracticalcis]|uniref:CAP domain-containing protein n=1 Tax=Thermanaerosceptrum fracticalcis TaxID=1712410 RepID=UPI003B838BB2